MRLSELPTPSLLLDRAVLERNCARMKGRARALDVALRPHLKTAKSVEVARRAVDGGGITVSTLREASHFVDHGLGDLTWAVGLTPDKLLAARALARQASALRVITDDLEVARAIGAQREVTALVEIDVGQHRGGVEPESDLLLELGRALGERCAGVLAHAGHAYGARSIAEIRAIAEDERRLTVLAAERLRTIGLPAPVVSVGSTPTAVHAEHLRGVTELRAGVYTLGDLFQAAIGSSAEDDIAASVLASVIGIRRRERTVVLDAGALALSKDRSLDEVGGAGYGLVVEPFRATVAAVNQEHGLVHFDGEVPPDLRVGTRVRILPNHACMTAAMYPAFDVVEDGEVVDRWERANGFGP